MRRARLINLVRAFNITGKLDVECLKAVRDCCSVDMSSNGTVVSLYNTRSEVQSSFVHRASTLAVIPLLSIIQHTLTEVRTCTQERVSESRTKIVDSAFVWRRYTINVRIKPEDLRRDSRR